MKKTAFFMAIVMLLSLTACAKREYLPKDGNDAVAAAEKIEYETVESDCRANSYDFDIELDTKDNTISGDVEINITNKSGKPLSEICLRYFAPAITKYSKITSVKSGGNKSLSFEKEVNNTFIRIPLGDDALKDGETIDLIVSFSSQIPEIADRFGVDVFDSKKIYNMCFCFPQLAFLDDGIWSDTKYIEAGEATYNETSDYYVTLKAPKDYVVLSSGRSETEGNITTIEALNVRELAITACNFAEVETREACGITFNILKPEYDYENKKFLEDMYGLILETAIESVEIFTEKIGDYVYDELDIIPSDLGVVDGMEMPGLIMVGISPSVDNDEIVSYFDNDVIKGIIQTTSHEVGHEWFCHGVGNDQGIEPWLDESFTSYVDNYYCNNAKRALELYQAMADKFYTDPEYFNATLENSIPNITEAIYINLPVEKYIKNAYTMVYTVGTTFFNELEKEMGEKIFFEMLSDWYNDNLNKVTDGYAFVQHILEYDDSDEVKKIINTFISDEYLR